MIFFTKLLIINLLFLSTLFSYDKITIANGEWPPYFSKKLENFGTTSHIVTKAFELENIDIEYKWYPWNRGFHLAKNGDLDATLGWSKTEQREKHFLFSEPILEDYVVFFHLKSFDFKYTTIEKLKDLKIGTISGYSYGNSLKRLKQNKEVRVFDVIKEEKLIELLLNNRFDLIIMNLNVINEILEKNFKEKESNKITYNKKAFHIEQLRVLFNKNKPYNKEYLKRFNKGLKKLKESGEFSRIYKKSN